MTAYKPVNFREKLGLILEQWQPKVVAEMNDYQFKLVKLEGDFVWHRHEDTDETFIVLDGKLRIDFRDGAVTINGGEMFVVPKGVEHKPYAEREVKMLLIEPRGVPNTGTFADSLTRRGRAGTPHPAVLRDHRQPRHVQGRLVAGHEDAADPVGDHTRCATALRARGMGPRRRPRRAVLPARRLHPGPRPRRRSPRQGQELKDLFWAEAEKYKVLPLLATLSAFFGILPPIPDAVPVEYRGDVQNVMSGMIPRIYNHSYAISADLVVPAGGAEGVIVAEADHMGGFSL